MHTSPRRDTQILLCGAILILLMAITAAQAQTSLDVEFDNQEKPWQEIAVLLPAAPLAENLLPFYVSPIATQTYAIDAKSLSVGEDGVIRYTLVSHSENRAQNVSYEGVRCQSKEMKLYAFGHPDGTWSRSRRDQWQRIVSSVANRAQAALAQDYFCQVGLTSGTALEIAARIKARQALTNYAE